jgi:hypothetical protein
MKRPILRLDHRTSTRTNLSLWKLLRTKLSSCTLLTESKRIKLFNQWILLRFKRGFGNQSTNWLIKAINRAILIITDSGRKNKTFHEWKRSRTSWRSGKTCVDVGYFSVGTVMNGWVF